MFQPLAALFEHIDRYDDLVPLQELQSRLEALTIGLEDVRSFAHFDREHYCRNLVHKGPAYQALILCWRNGQRSPIHDHRGSSCGVRVIHGTATETVFKRNTDGMIVPTGSRELPEGSVLGSFDTDIHQMSNLQPGRADLVTLHVYSPPLLVMGTYSLTDTTVREFADPISSARPAQVSKEKPSPGITARA